MPGPYQHGHSLLGNANHLPTSSPLHLQLSHCFLSTTGRISIKSSTGVYDKKCRPNLILVLTGQSQSRVAWMIGVPIPVGQEFLFFATAQTDFWERVAPSLLYNGYQGLGHEGDHSPLSTAEAKNA